MKGKAAKPGKLTTPTVHTQDSSQFKQYIETSGAISTLSAAFQSIQQSFRPLDPPIDQLRGVLGNPEAVQLQTQIAELKTQNSGLEKQLEELRKQAAAKGKTVAVPKKKKK